MKTYIVWLHPDDDVEELKKIPKEFLPFEVKHPDKNEYYAFKRLIAPWATDDEFWAKGTAYIVKNQLNKIVFNAVTVEAL